MSYYSEPPPPAKLRCLKCGQLSVDAAKNKSGYCADCLDKAVTEIRVDGPFWQQHLIHYCQDQKKWRPYPYLLCSGCRPGRGSSLTLKEISDYLNLLERGS